MRKRDNKNLSMIERESQFKVDSNAIATARLMSEDLLSKAQKLHDYLHGKYADPYVVNIVQRLANDIAYHMNTAISVRLAIFELKRKKKANQTTI